MLLVYSGGLDSTSALFKYKDMIKLAVSFDYGSHHNKAEIVCAKLNCDNLRIPHIIIDIKNIGKQLKSNLLEGEIPHGHYADDNMAATVVPFRNGIMLSIAAGIAESNKLNSICLASHKGDYSQYPDCRPEFNSGMYEAVLYGTSNKVEFFTPFSDLDKRQIARLGLEAGMQPELTYSCYEGDAIHCGKCGTCVERIWALKDVEEFTVYKDNEYAKNILKEKEEW